MLLNSVKTWIIHLFAGFSCKFWRQGRDSDTRTRGSSDPPPSSTPPPVPTSSEGHPPSEDTVLNIELAKSRLDELLRTLERKDIIVKAKRSRPPSKAPSSMPQRGGSAPAAETGATPSPPLTTCRAIIMVRCQRTLILAGMFPPPSPLPWAAA